MSAAKDYNSHISQGDHLMIEKRTKEAVEEYNKAIAIDPKNFLGFLNKALALQQMNKFSEALEAYNKTLEIQEKLTLALIGQGTVLSQLQKYQQSLQTFNIVLIQQSKHPGALLGQSTSLYQMGQLQECLLNLEVLLDSDPKNVAGYYLKGKVLNDLGLLEEAIQQFDQAYEKDKKHTNSLIGKGNVYLQQNKFKQANSCFDQVIKIDAMSHAAYEGKGSAYKGQQQYEEAIESYSQAILLNNKSIQAHLGLGHTYTEIKEFENALKSYSKVIELDEKYVVVYNGIANVLYDLKRFDQALQNYDQAIELEEMYFIAYNGKGNTLYHLKRYEEALECYTKAVSINPKYIGGHYGRGTVLRELKMIPEALQSFTKAVQLSPQFSVGFQCKGVILYELNEFEESVQNYDLALQHDDRNPNLYYLKGNALQEIGKYHEALESYRQAIELNKTPKYLFQLGKIHFLLNHKQRAHDTFVEAKHMFSNMKDTRKSEQKMRQFYEQALTLILELLKLQDKNQELRNQIKINISEFNDSQILIQDVDKFIRNSINTHFDNYQQDSDQHDRLQQEIQTYNDSIANLLEKILLFEELVKQFGSIVIELEALRIDGETIVKHIKKYKQYRNGFYTQFVSAYSLCADFAINEQRFAESEEFDVLFIPLSGPTLESSRSPRNMSDIKNKCENIMKFSNKQNEFQRVIQYLIYSILMDEILTLIIFDEKRAHQLTQKFAEKMNQIVEEIQTDRHSDFDSVYQLENSPQFQLGQKHSQEILNTIFADIRILGDKSQDQLKQLIQLSQAIITQDVLKQQEQEQAQAQQQGMCGRNDKIWCKKDNNCNIF